MFLDEFKKGDFSILKDIDPLTRLAYVSSIDDENIIKNLLIDTINSNDQYKIANTLFNLWYKNPKYLNYIIELLDNNLINLEIIQEHVVDDIIHNTSWGFEYFFYNIEKINTKFMKPIIKYALKDKELHDMLLSKITMTENKKLRDLIMLDFLIYSKYLTNEELLKFIDNPNKVKSRIPRMCLSFFENKDKYKKLYEFILENYEIFFENEISEKMELYSFLKKRINIDKLSKYNNLFRFYQAYESVEADQIISTLINNNDYQFLDKLIEGKDISFVGSGTTTKVYRVDDKVIKFTRNKHEENIKIKDLYLIAPTITKYISFNDDDLMVLEIQDYLDNKEVTRQDVLNWINEMDKMGYMTTDPLVMGLQIDNFGFLKDYKEANLGDMKDSDIPEWFKKRPVVLYDIDLIYKKDEDKKKIMKFY